MFTRQDPDLRAAQTEDLARLLSAVEAASRDTSLLALNMALDGASAAAVSAAQIAHAVGDVSIRATQFSQQMRGCLQAGADRLDADSLHELRRVTRSVAELMAELSDLASGILDGITDPHIERRLPQVVPDLLDQVRSRARVLDQFVDAIPEMTRPRGATRSRRRASHQR
jgi:hypothetical protein